MDTVDGVFLLQNVAMNSHDTYDTTTSYLYMSMHT